MTSIERLKLKLFADGADLRTILALSQNPLIKGFTTNPTLMRKAGVSDYERFAREVIEAIPDRSVSFEVLADDFEDMRRQALAIAAWGKNVYVKVPVTNTLGESAAELMHALSHSGVKVNATAIMTIEQVHEVVFALAGGAPSYVSIFAGRVADTGRDPIPTMRAALSLLQPYPSMELIWASPRELLNVFQAEEIGCHILTATSDILQKLQLVGRDLPLYSLDTVRMFYHDACSSGFTLDQTMLTGEATLAAAALPRTAAAAWPE